MENRFRYTVTFYGPCDDGSHPFGDWNLFHETPEAAFAYAEAEVERLYRQMQEDARKQDWYDGDEAWERRVERDTYVVEVRRHE